jgi:hypothetical protein
MLLDDVDDFVKAVVDVRDMRDEGTTYASVDDFDANTPSPNRHRMEAFMILEG